MATESSSAEPKRQLPSWQAPSSKPADQLRLLNSLTRQKEPFFTKSGDKKVSWYICGPTVYDSAHMGHARSYISFDILRRILSSYFGYDVQYVMNVTDIDDKIIKRSRQRHLFNEYKTKLVSKCPKETVVDFEQALDHLKAGICKEANPDKQQVLKALLCKAEKQLSDTKAAIAEKSGDAKELVKSLVDSNGDVVSEWLDSQFGSKLTDQSIFMELARHFEQEFHGDMKSLNVLPPDVLTRVSEYVPEIVKFIEKIIENGFAYETQGENRSVYFDTKTFNDAPGHYYAKLVPEHYGGCDRAEMQKAIVESEGELSVSDEKQQEKRAPYDFALWKASKPGEPFWESPRWGQGRPGWHIECSAMATAICGQTLDIHAGGFDLKFPHHDNEIAQTEAYYGKSQWINYFLHAGTLRIAGLKMSKSLKNFITIKDALKQHTARQLRILFLLHQWSDVLDFSVSTMERAVGYEKMCNEFFLLVKHILRVHFNSAQANSYVKYDAAALQLQEKFSETKQKIHSALCDSIDTRTALEAIRELISDSNVYVNSNHATKSVPNCLILRQIAIYLTDLFRIFGLMQDSSGEIGFGDKNSSVVDREELLMPYLDAMSKFREEVRQIAKEERSVKILTECDKLRDDILPELGVRLEDKESFTVIKLVDREVLLREKEQKLQIEREKQAEKERKKREAEEKEMQKRIPPEEFFQTEAEKSKYSKFDAKGIPTHNSCGDEIPKTQRKKLEKQWEQQAKKYKDYLNNHGDASKMVNGDS